MYVGLKMLGREREREKAKFIREPVARTKDEKHQVQEIGFERIFAKLERIDLRTLENSARCG